MSLQTAVPILQPQARPIQNQKQFRSKPGRLTRVRRKIVRRYGSSQVNEVNLTEPIEGFPAEVVEPSKLGGTRHLWAAQFVRNPNDAPALVASQDGRLTIFAWSPCENMVQAHRIDVLLL